MTFLPGDTKGLISRSWNGTPISRRTTDGYVNATAMCKANGKHWNDYWRLDRATEYLEALSDETGISVSKLCLTMRGSSHQGTWIHPRVAVDLARWISAPFAVWMDGWFLDELEKRTAGTAGSAPKQDQLESWKHFHDRIDLTHSSVPSGFFCVFQESAQMIVPMIRADVIISDRVIPDISVGRVWSKYWKDNEFDLKYGRRLKYDHNYPDYYPQAASNPQPSYAYPDASLGEFRSWLRKSYIAVNLSDYILRQYKTGKLPQESASKVLKAFELERTLLAAKPKTA
jgi:hypothetical protein